MYSSPTAVMSDDTFCLFILCAVPSQKKMQVRFTQDGAICAKNSTFGYFDGTNPITEKGIQLRSPTPIMACGNIHCRLLTLYGSICAETSENLDCNRFVCSCAIVL